MKNFAIKLINNDIAKVIEEQLKSLGYNIETEKREVDKYIYVSNKTAYHYPNNNQFNEISIEELFAMSSTVIKIAGATVEQKGDNYIVSANSDRMTLTKERLKDLFDFFLVQKEVGRFTCEHLTGQVGCFEFSMEDLRDLKDQLGL